MPKPRKLRFFFARYRFLCARGEKNCEKPVLLRAEILSSEDDVDEVLEEFELAESALCLLSDAGGAREGPGWPWGAS